MRKARMKYSKHQLLSLAILSLFFYYIDFGIFLCIIPFIGMEFFSLVRLCVQMRDDLGVICILYNLIN